MKAKSTSFNDSLAMREQFSDRYLQDRDPIAEDRMLWRAQTFRHQVHLMPEQMSIVLENAPAVCVPSSALPKLFPLHRLSDDAGIFAFGER